MGVGNKSPFVIRLHSFSYLAHFGEVNNRGIAKHSSSASWVKRGDYSFHQLVRSQGSCTVVFEVC